MGPYEERNAKVDNAMQKINSKKSAEEIEEDVEREKDHTPADVSHLAGKNGVPDFWSKTVLEHFVL